MDTDTLRIVVIEGPAGSGKSEISKQLVRYDDFSSITLLGDLRFPRPRKYTGIGGIILSAFKDQLSICSAAMQITEENKIQVIDRCLLSQWVYGTLRAGKFILDEAEGRNIILAGMETAMSMLSSIGSRDLDTSLIMLGRFKQIEVMFFVLCPSIDLLEGNRELSEKLYPYAPAMETALYTSAAKILYPVHERTVWSASQKYKLRYQTITLSFSTWNSADGQAKKSADISRQFFSSR